MAEAEAPSDKLTVDNYNWEIVKDDIPNLGLRHLIVVARDKPTTPLPVHEISDIVRNCELVVRFVDTFYSATDATWDIDRLRLLMSGRSLTIRVFYGHLNQAGINLLPRSIFELGLAIGNAVDAEVVSGLKTWRGLNELRVSVNRRVEVEDLRPLPKVRQLGIVFPDLTDDRVSIVAQAIATLAPKKRLTVLYFPKSLVTAAGALHLAETIRDMDELGVDFEIIIEPCGEWLPNEEEKERLKEIMKNRVAIQKISWSMSWIYEG